MLYAGESQLVQNRVF